MEDFRPLESAQPCGCDPKAGWVCLTHYEMADANVTMGPAMRGRDPRHGDPRFYKLLEEISELHSRKNHDYAKTDEPLSNFHRSAAFGVEPWRGVLVRMSDKWSRIEQLAGGKTAKNESLRDSLIDLAVYALLCVLLTEDAAKP